DRDKDLAASLQKCLEKAYFHILNYLYEETRCDALCLAGGVALNSVANGQIFDKTPFRRIYTQAAAGDDGTALGVAYYIHNCVLDQPRHYVMEHAYTGREYTDEEIKNVVLAESSIVAERVEDGELYRRTAEAIAEGKIVGWFQGRMEWGPRALGNRSIV